MGNSKRFDMYFEPFIGFGIRFGHWLYRFEIIIHLPFLTIMIGLGKEQGHD